MEKPFENSYWIIDNKFLAGMYPGSYTKEMNFINLTALIGLRIDAIINLTGEEEENAYFNGTYVEKYIELAEGRHFEANHFRFTINDMDIPSVELMVSILDKIDECLALGSNVYLHCIGGTGRTGTVAGCYLVRHGIAEPLNAVEKIRSLRGDGKRSPETDQQEEFVSNWKPGQ